MDKEKLMTVTDKSAPDYGCTYFELSCKHCQALLGKSYITTTQPMDHLRGLITLNVDKLTLYELSGFGQDQPLFNENRDAIVQETGAMGNETLGLEQEINRLRLDVTKVALTFPAITLYLVEAILFALGTRQSKHPTTSGDQTRSSIVEIKHTFIFVVHSLISSTINL